MVAKALWARLRDRDAGPGEARVEAFDRLDGERRLSEPYDSANGTTPQHRFPRLYFIIANTEIPPWDIMGLPLRDHEHHTYADYCRWPEDTRYELIDGWAYAMAPAPIVPHQELVGEIYRQIANQLQDSPCRPFIAPIDVRLPKLDEADEKVETVVQPDVLVVCDPAKIDRRGVRGAPDWVIEVISEGTAGHDQVTKLALYERHGVREYWLVHPVDKVLTAYRLEAGAYGKPHVQELLGESHCKAVTGVYIEWERATRRL